MSLISPILYGGISQLPVTVGSTITTVTATVTKEFFQQIFLNPGENSTTVMIFCGVVVLACVGLAFLIKKLYDKYIVD